MSSNGMNNYCDCLEQATDSGEHSSLILLSTIPNQKIYRCSSCHAFLSYTDDLKQWEILLQGDIEEELKTLYPVDERTTGAA